MDRCPKACRISARLAFPATRCEASECFRTCGWRFSTDRPALSATV